MKRYTLFLFILACCAFVWGTTIKWTWKDKPVQQYIIGGDRLEFGLRSDGVVVWREITNTTNSPADIMWTNVWLYDNSIILTNMPLYNGGLIDATNSIYGIIANP